MQPTNALLQEMATLLATDPASLAPATDALFIHLSASPFSPSLETDLTDITAPTFTGYAAKSPVVGAQPKWKDPATGEWIIQLKPPAGGFVWVTTDAVGLPQTIFGYVVTDHTNAITYGSALLPTPVTLTAGSQGVDIGEVTLRLTNSALS